MDTPRRRRLARTFATILVAVGSAICSHRPPTPVDVAQSLRHLMRATTATIRIATPPPAASIGNSIGVRG